MLWFTEFLVSSSFDLLLLFPDYPGQPAYPGIKATSPIKYPLGICQAIYSNNAVLVLKAKVQDGSPPKPYGCRMWAPRGGGLVLGTDWCQP